MLAEKNTYIESAYQQLQTISQDRQKWLEYEARLKATLDYNQGMLEAEQRGIEKGVQQGVKQGFQQGFQQGLQQAEQCSREQVARNLLQLGVANEIIIQSTGLSSEKIDQLRKQL